MKAFLMSAGRGTRIKSVTDEPKSLLKVKNKSILKNTIDMLISRNIYIYIVVGFKEELIRKELEEYKNIKIISNVKYNETNSIYSLYQVINEIDDECIIMNADVYWNEKMLDSLINYNNFSNAIMLGDSSRIKDGDYFLKTNNLNIVDYGKELILEDRDFEYVGIAKIHKKFLNKFKDKLTELIEAKKFNLWWENTLYELSLEYNILVYDINGIFWGEVDTKEDYIRILDNV